MRNFTDAKSSEIEVRNKITVITFFCSLLVIWIHALNLETYGISETSVGLSRFIYYLEHTWGNLTRIAVPFFFFISGWLFFRTFALKKLLAKYKSRITSVLIPYIVWCTFYYLIFAVLTSLPVISNYINTGKAQLSFVGWLNALWIDEYYTLWFLKEIIIYILFCPLIYVLLKNKYVGGAILLLLLVNEQFGIFSLPLSGYLYYLVGAYIAINFKQIEYRKSKGLTLLSCFILLIIAISRFELINYVVIKLLFILATWFSLDLVPLKKQFPWWMRISFFTYVAHDLFLEAFEKIVFMLFEDGAIFALLAYIFIPIMVFFVLVIIAAFLKKFTPKVWSIATGMR